MKLLPIVNSDPSSVTAPTVSDPSSAPRSLLKNISWSFVGLAGYAASQWGMLIVLARLTSPEIVGQFTISLAFTSPIMLLAGLDLRLVQAADANRQFAFSDYLGLRLVMALIAFALITILNVLLGYEAGISTIIVAMAVAKSLEMQSDAFHGLFQQRERMDLFAQSLLTRGAISLVLFATAMHVTQSLTVGVVALGASSLAVILQRDVPNALKFLPGGWSGLLNSTVAPEQMFRLFVAALPAGLRAFLVSFESSLPNFFLQKFHGDHAVGSFAALAYSLVVVLTFARSFNQPAVPRLAMLSAQGDAAGFHRLLRRLCALGALLGGAGMVAVLIGGHLFLNLAYGQTYAEQYPILIILMAASAIRLAGLPVAAALASLNCFTTLFVTQIVAVASLACFSVVLVPSYGLQGAAYAISLVSIVLLLGHAALSAFMIPGVLKRRAEHFSSIVTPQPIQAAA